MTDFINFITKNIETFEKDNERTFSGHISAEVVDHQNEFIFVKEIIDIMDVFMKNLPVISEVHTNRMIGKVLKYEESTTGGHPSVKIYGKVFKDDKVTLYDDVWNKIKSGVYTGLSMGGGSRHKESMMKDGKIVMNLKNLELYEIAVCPSPANPLALIDKYNEFAKSDILLSKTYKTDTDKNIAQCDSIRCEFNKGINSDKDIDIDNNNKETLGVIKDDTSNSSEIVEDTRRKEQDEDNIKSNNLNKQEEVPSKKVDESGNDEVDQFNKPKIKKDHIPSVTDEKEEEAKNKIREDDIEDKQDRTNISKDEEIIFHGLLNNHLELLNNIIRKNNIDISHLKTIKNELI